MTTELAAAASGGEPDAWELAARAFETEAATDITTPAGLATAIDPHTRQTPALDLIDQALADVDAGTCRRLIIAVPPQEGKSTRVARVGTLWALKQNPDRRCAIASYDLDLARGHSQWIRDAIDTHGADAPLAGGIDLLGLRLRHGSRAASRFALAGHRGGVVATGVAGGLTGKPVDWMVIDDPVKDRVDADSETMRNRVWAWWTDVVIPRLGRGGTVILVMTRWHEDDLAGRLIAEDAAQPEARRLWRVLHIPAQAEAPNPDRGIAPDPLGRAPGEFLESARGRSVEDWEEKKRTTGARTWAALYQGRPAPMEGGIFQWDWIRPYRCNRADVPHLQRVAVAVDPTGGGHDAAGIIAAGRGTDGRTYFLGDRSGQYTAGGQWRHAWFTVLDQDADELVYESNLVDPVMRRAIPAAWRRMREQATALRQAGLLDQGDDVDDEQLLAIAARLTGTGDDDVQSSDDPPRALAAQLRQLLPYAARILDAPERGPARVTGVRATRGKTTRAEPMAQAYETGQVSHVGALPAYEAELVTWQEGQDSPNRLDAGVWAWVALNRSQPATTSSPAGSGRRVPRGPQSTGGHRATTGGRGRR